MERKLLTLVFLFSVLTGFGQSPVWSPANTISKSRILPTKKDFRPGKIYSLDIERLKSTLSQAPKRGRFSGRSKIVVQFPDAEGKLERFAIVEAPVLHPELGARYPGIKSYAGQGIDDPSATIRFSISHLGLSSMKRSSDQGSVFIEPYSEDRTLYIVYDRKNVKSMSAFECTLQEDMLQKTTGKSSARNADDGILRTYRLAISTSGEYTQYFGGTKIDALAAINTTMTRVNGIFENDFAVTMVLIANTDGIIYTDPGSDPYNEDFNNELQNTLTTVIGEENYDIGHLFTQGSSNGNAGCIGCVCTDNQKGSGFTSHTTPEGDNFDVDFVAHEMGHQFGANHTFSIQDEITDAHFEPGSGSTIMGYAGITGDTDVQEHSDPYFHAFSIEQITNYVKSTTCQSDTPTGNNIPTANAGMDYTIPKGTPFSLTGEGADANTDDVLTYCWEQMDEDDASLPFPTPTATSGPVFRSISPSTSSTRYFPAIPTALDGNTGSQWEMVPIVGRELNFRLTVRDNRDGGAANSSDDVTITVADDAGPFTIPPDENPTSVAGGGTYTITWDVAGTNTGAINVQEVDILLSLSKDSLNLIPLATHVENDGSHEVTFPDELYSNARIMIRAVDHIFYTISKEDLTIKEFALDLETTDFTICKPNDLEFAFTYQATADFSEEVTFSATDVPDGATVSFDPATETGNNTTVNVVVSDIDSLDAGAYTFSIIGEAGTLTDEIPINIDVHDVVELDNVAPLSPFNASNNLDLNTKLEWTGVSDIQSYTVQIATDQEFTTVIEESHPVDSTYITQNLEYGAAYYWRVKPIGFCSEGQFSEPFLFYTTSSAPVCDQEYVNDSPVPIDSSSPSTVTSSIEITDTGKLSDIAVGLNISHTYVSDLAIELTSPSGKDSSYLNRGLRIK